MNTTCTSLEQKLIPGIVTLEKGSGGFPLLRVRNEHAECDIYPYGAHIVGFRPRDGEELLWVSPYGNYEKGKPIRGGVPVCFPWFGPHGAKPELPLHGFARIREWDVESIRALPDGSTRIVFTLSDDEASRAMWSFSFRLEYAVTVGKKLELQLSIKNTGAEPFECAEGFHTYFKVGNPARCEISGLDGVGYIDRANGNAREVQSGILKLARETVNAYMHAPAMSVLKDIQASRIIKVEQDGMHATVVWNPWETTGLKTPEIREAWDQFLCVESFNCLDCLLNVGPKSTHRSVVTYGAEELGHN
jgi:glucose-6-phosphate 1-epimerase